MKKTIKKVKANNILTSLLPENAHDLLASKGIDLIEKIGADAIRNVLHEVFSGRNLRDSTEFLTRARITALNLALVKMYSNGAAENPNFISELPELAAKQLITKGLGKEEKMLSQWSIGLTGKATQNVLRNSDLALASYKEKYKSICKELSSDATATYGELKGNVSIGEQTFEVDWEAFASILNTTGSQTLAIRGSEKSAYGKLFEKLILGTLLSLLDFKYASNGIVKDKSFWLSTREHKRESDATLLYQKGKGIRFDIGFIGKGNSEITLDKVSRFERHAEIAQEKYFMSTVIIVDTIGKGSRVEDLAKEIGGEVVQMSGSYWVREVAKIIKNTMGDYNHPILELTDEKMEEYFTQELPKIDVLKFLEAAKDDVEEDNDIEEDEEYDDF